MSSRLSCWVHGHAWGEWSGPDYRDLVGNAWKLRWCDQCSATQRRCVGMKSVVKARRARLDALEREVAALTVRVDAVVARVDRLIARLEARV